jgi:hypothetical protein
MYRLKVLWATVCAVTLSIALATGAAGADDKKSKGDNVAGAQALFDRLKNLQGEWVAAKPGAEFKKDQPVVIYRLTAGGSALAETIMPGTNHEMLSVYHRDGDQLLMTHYCCMGNQPRMKAKAGKERDEIVLEFVGGTNLNPETDSHVHSGVIRIVDNDHLRSEWSFYIDGKPGDKQEFELVRKKIN